MTTVQPYPPSLPSQKRNWLWFGISLASIAVLAFGLSQARGQFRHVFVDFHVELGVLTKILLLRLRALTTYPLPLFGRMQ
jgi:hypothetical protein